MSEEMCFVVDRAVTCPFRLYPGNAICRIDGVFICNKDKCPLRTTNIVVKAGFKDA